MCCGRTKLCRSFTKDVSCVYASLGARALKRGRGNDVCEQARKLRAGGFEPAVFGAVNLALFTQDKIPRAQEP